MKGQAALPLIIGVVVAVLIAVSLFPTVWNGSDLNTCATKNDTGKCGTGAVWNNQTPYSSTVVAMMNLAPLFVALGIGVVGVALVMRSGGKAF